MSFKKFSSFLVFLVLLVLFLQISPASAQKPRGDEDEDRCSPNKTEKRRLCERGIILPLWPPADTSVLTPADTAARAIVFLLALIYLFLGVSIIADRFMASIEVITSKEREVVYKNSSGEQATTTVRVWNETVSNLTLMALGSSAPEIMLSVIEICGKGFYAGDLGPSTIVGSASFNLFIIMAICMYVIPDGEIRKVKHPRVFFVTATWSILAYVWLYIILAVSSHGIVEIWEGVVTFLFFPILVVFAWVADRRLLVYKLMYKKYRTRHRTVIVETEGEPDSDVGKAEGVTNLHLTELGENGKTPTEMDGLRGDANVIFSDTSEEIIDPEADRKYMIQLMRDLRQKHPEADMTELSRLAENEALQQKQKSRAFYRIQATRILTGAGNILHKSKADHMRSSENLAHILNDEDDSVTQISFNPAEYRVLENCGYAELFVSRRGGDINMTLYVDYRTEDGTANAGSDYVATEEILVFEPGETVKKIEIEILDDDIFEEDEYFTVHLFNVRTGASDGMFDTDANSAQVAKLEPPAVANVIILDDDHAGVFSFAFESMTVSENKGELSVEVQRNSGARGKVVVPYKTVSGTAKGGGKDYEDAFGELVFENDETTTKPICVVIVDNNKYYKRINFKIELGEPIFKSKPYGTDAESDSGINGKEELKPLTEEEEEERRIAELGKPRLGLYPTIEIMIEESYEFKSTVDKLLKKANLAVIVGTSSWREQFFDALSVSGGDDDESDENKEPTCFDYVMHYLTVFWKLMFAFVPPTEYLGGWACFSVSIIMIGVLTAVIGDVASQFGCVVNLNDAVTAVTLVAMGTSVPDTFASKVSAVGDQYADASIGNVTGSNAVNVFLGIGIAWTIAAIYWAVKGEGPDGKYFRVQPGNLAFSVTVFSLFAIIAIGVLMFRRRSKSIGGELGGPRVSKIICSIIFVTLWIVYILLSALDSYCIIKTF